MKRSRASAASTTEIESITKLLKEAKYAIFLTGAGISTDSGIPDFRSPKTGLWNQKDAKILTEPGAMEKSLEFFWKVGYQIGKKLLKAKPNKAHEILASWENDRKIVKAIITQNVDGLHQKAGSRNVIELHGNAFECKCAFCGGSYTMKELLRIYKQTGRQPPNCQVCAFPLRPNIVLFGEPMPREAMEQAVNEIRQADLAILLGSSSVVYPANYLPVIARENGTKIVIVNEMDTDLDQLSEVVIHGSISHVLQRIDALL
ncbi:MAG TPA: NAD-dependent deacylase [Candidatus Lokiarchaeia archaeon]|nr:NAD-dependent deacylase [Candidatus Lokiarchaeia archaeon]